MWSALMFADRPRLLAFGGVWQEGGRFLVGERRSSQLREDAIEGCTGATGEGESEPGRSLRDDRGGCGRGGSFGR